MNIKIERALDQISIKILRELQINARSTFSEIGRKVGLSSPAVAERVYKMEESGIINGYHTDIILNPAGIPVLAFITLTTHSEKNPKIYSFIEKTKEIIECHLVSGNESLILKVITHSVSQLDSLIEKLSEYGKTKTSIVLSSPIKKTINLVPVI